MMEMREKKTTTRAGLPCNSALHEISDFIPLTQADLDNGLSPKQIEQLHAVLDINAMIREMYQLGLKIKAKDK